MDREQFIEHIDIVEDHIESLEKQNAELAAQVEALRGGLNQAIELLVTALVEPKQITEEEIHDLRTLEQSTPSRHLRNIQAEAGRDGFVAGYSKGWNDYAGPHGFRREELADAYAAKVREGGE